LKNILVSNENFENDTLELKKYIRTKNKDAFQDKVKNKKTDSLSKHVSDIFESLIGAIYCDQGGFIEMENDLMDIKGEFIHKNLLNVFFETSYARNLLPNKSKLVNLSNVHLQENPVYELIGTANLDSNRHIFIMGLYLKKRLVAIDEGSTKKIAEKNVALKGVALFNFAEVLNVPLSIDNIEYILKDHPDLLISVSLTSRHLQLLKSDKKILSTIEQMKSEKSITTRFSLLGRNFEKELMYFYAVDFQPKK
jgi:dsRNA-specific ribonuclease